MHRGTSRFMQQSGRGVDGMERGSVDTGPHKWVIRWVESRRTRNGEVKPHHFKKFFRHSQQRALRALMQKLETDQRKSDIKLYEILSNRGPDAEFERVICGKCNNPATVGEWKIFGDHPDTCAADHRPPSWARHTLCCNSIVGRPYNGYKPPDGSPGVMSTIGVGRTRLSL